MDNAAVFTWMLPNIRHQRSAMMKAKLDSTIYQYGFALCFKERMGSWMRSFAVSDYDYCYPLAFIQAWGTTQGLTITSRGTGQGTVLLIADDRTSIKTKPIPSLDGTDEGFYQYPAGAVADPRESEFAQDELETALSQLVWDLLWPFRRELKEIAFSIEFYKGIFDYRYIEKKIDIERINNESTPWDVYNGVDRVMHEIETILTELSKTGGQHAASDV